MSVTEPRLKKNCKLEAAPPLPLTPRKFKGKYNEFCVVVENDSEMRKIISQGYFGKATLSRNYPEFHKKEIIRARVFKNRKKFKCGSPRKIIVVPDSDSEDYFKNLKPEFQLDSSGIGETVNLCLEEAFFLAHAVNSLDVTHNERILTVEEMWDLFQADKFFAINYLVYFYFRSKNWVVKPGIKFGGDFLLYKQGPPFYHASYVLVIHTVDEDFNEKREFKRRSMKMQHLMGLNRLCETSGKELLICQVIIPKSVTIHFTNLNKFSIKETVMKRWVSSQRQTD